MGKPVDLVDVFGYGPSAQGWPGPARGRALKPEDFLDRQHCNWFRIGRKPNELWGCKTCSALSKTRTCPAFPSDH